MNKSFDSKVAADLTKERTYDKTLTDQKTINALRRKMQRANETDEWYTAYAPIAQELSQYPKEIWMDKNIICPCDWDVFPEDNIYSVTFTFEENVETFDGDLEDEEDIYDYMIDHHIKIPEGFDVHDITQILNVCTCSKNEIVKIDRTLWDTVEYKTETITKKEAIDALLKRIKCNFVLALLAIAGPGHCRSITASGYKPDFEAGLNGIGYDFLKVDYSKYDIVVTNPPFSQYGKFMDILTEHVTTRPGRFNYILLAPFKNRMSPMFAEGLQTKQHYLGFGRNTALTFTTAEDMHKFLPDSKAVACDWITTYPYGQDYWNEKDAQRLYKISSKPYLDMYGELPDVTFKDGTHPIIVNGRSLPDDYAGWMKGPGSLLDKDFDTRTWDIYVDNAKAFFNTKHPELNPCVHKFTDTMRANEAGKIGFPGVFIKRKPEYVKEHKEITWYDYNDVLNARKAKEEEKKHEEIKETVTTQERATKDDEGKIVLW